jgi:hypothetical protein
MSEREEVLLTALDEAVEAREGTYFQLDYPTERDHAIKQYAEAREAIRRALTPARRVVTDLRLVVTRYGDVCHRSLRYIKDAATLQALARDWDADDGHLAPHRVVRVALVETDSHQSVPSDHSAAAATEPRVVVTEAMVEAMSRHVYQYALTTHADIRAGLTAALTEAPADGA